MRIPSAYRHDFAGDLELLSEGMIVTLVSILLVSWFGELGATPREDQTPTFRAESDPVLVDLVVTDRSGQFVDDLNLEEVQVLEDGKVQDIRFFRLERTRAAELNPGPDEIPEPSRDPEGRKATAATAGGYYLFLLDLQTMDHNSVERSKESIREFLRSKIDPRDQTMLATIRPQFRVDQPMTQDFSKLEAALDRISYRHEKASLERFAERVDHIFSTGGPLARAGCVDGYHGGSTVPWGSGDASGSVVSGALRTFPLPGLAPWTEARALFFPGVSSERSPPSG